MINLQNSDDDFYEGQSRRICRSCPPKTQRGLRTLRLRRCRAAPMDILGVVSCYSRAPKTAPPVTTVKPASELASGHGSPRRILCAVCGAAITTVEDRIAIAGSHEHRRINPAGFEFEFGCFRSAEGAAVVGVPTTEHVWFAGYAWSFSICRGCHSHLGWCFEGKDAPTFHGLILDRLIEEIPEPQRS